MRRVRDWRSRLATVIEGARRLPHVWGEHDCALFTADCILSMTGTDLAANWRGRYRDAAGALQTLHDAGFTDLFALAASYLEEIHPAFARAGDVMGFPGTAVGAFGIVNGERVTVLRLDGLGTLPRTRATRAFRVP